MPNSVSNRRKAAPAAMPTDPIAEGLRKLYRSVEDEPVPDDLLRLLDEIDAATANVPRRGDAA